MITTRRSLALPVIALLACGGAAPPAEAPATEAAPVAAQPQSQPAGQPAAAAPADAAVAINNARTPRPGLLTGGQPTEAQIADIGEAGFGVVINLRSTREEPEFSWEQAAVEAAGMTYVHIPMAGADDLTAENAKALRAALAAAGDAGGAVVHCKSGNRVGALLAVDAVWNDGASVDDAMELGKAAGLTRLEPAVRTLLEAN